MISIPMRRFAFTALRALIALHFTCGGQAAETTNATGTWKWTLQRGGNNVETIAYLKQQGAHLTGTYRGRDGAEAALDSGTVDGDKIAFSITREREGQRFTTRFQGQLRGDVINGETTLNFGGENRTRPWQAKRIVEVAAKARGIWQWTFTTQNGQIFRPKLKLDQAENKITGVLTWGGSETPISGASIKGDQLTFNVAHERDGRTIITKYTGMIQGDHIMGRIESNWGDQDRIFEWSAERTPP